MELYLVQHGQAKPTEVDPQRPLTDEAKKNALLVGRYMFDSGVKIFKIFHSEKLRAKQTAEIFADCLHPSEGVQQIQGLSPMNAPEPIRDMLKGVQKSVMIVGHLPHLSRLLSLLITNNPEIEIVSFEMGGVVCLVKDREKWLIKRVYSSKNCFF